MYTIYNIGLLVMFTLLLSSLCSYADILVEPQKGDQLTSTVAVEVSVDPGTHFYTYNYTVTNNTDSAQEIWFFALDVGGDFVIIESASVPDGWLFGSHGDRPFVSWSAVGGDVPEGYVDSGNIPPSPYQVKPGETLSGFSITTLTPPESGKFYAQGFTPLPQVSGDAEELAEANYEVLDFTEDSFIGSTTTPMVAPYDGNRRPAVDGFLGFLNLSGGNDMFSAPVSIILKFSLAGESVDRTTFSATLNGVDVTVLFQVDGTGGGDLLASFKLDESPLQVGKNVLITSVEGTVPGTTRLASDVDRVVFIVQ